MTKIQAPKGTQDFYFPDVEKWQYLELQIREYYRKFLFSEVRTPIFEHSDLFQRGIGEETQVVQKEMYTFQDRGEKRSLTLRPENTASLMRCLIQHNLFDTLAPLKFYYIGPMFRAERPQKGRYRQFHQFGAEILGDDTPLSDAEVIFSAFDFLRHLGIEDMELLINSVGCGECRPLYLEELRKTAKHKEAELCIDCQKKVHTNPLRIFDCKQQACSEISQGFPKIIDNLCQECHSHFEQVKEGLSLIEIPYRLEPRLVRGLDYYTKTTFEITSGHLGAQNALLGGGRYNNLIKELGGPDLPGTGFAAGMERVIMHLTHIEIEEKKPVFIVFQNEALRNTAFQLLHQLWREGITAIMDYQGRNIKKQFKRADRLQARHTLILGEEEIASESVSVKDMRNQTQASIARKDIIKWLKENS